MVDYTRFVDLIHTYTNRDANVLPNDLIKNFVDMASDTVFRDLRIPPLEATFTYDPITEATSLIAIPGDTIEFIQLRKMKSDNITEVEDVYNARADIRSFYIDQMTKYDGFHYARENNNLVVYPELAVDDVVQLHYYKRLPSAYARFSLTVENYGLQLLYTGATQSECQDVVEAAEPGAFVADPDLLSQITYWAGDADIPEGWYLGMLAGHWLRDENLKLLLYGTQAEAYIYLKDVEKAQAFFGLRDQEIEMLNKEAVLRSVRGGVAQTHYEGGNLL
jgi:hypothetical protein